MTSKQIILRAAAEVTALIYADENNIERIAASCAALKETLNELKKSVDHQTYHYGLNVLHVVSSFLEDSMSQS